MTTILDTKIRPKVVAILAKYGRIVEVKIDTITTNESTGITTTTTTYHTVKCSPPEPFDTKYVNGDTIQTGDMSTLFAAMGLPFTPVVGMRVDEWTAVAVNRITSGDLDAAWEVQLRK